MSRYHRKVSCLVKLFCSKKANLLDTNFLIHCKKDSFANKQEDIHQKVLRDEILKKYSLS